MRCFIILAILVVCSPTWAQPYEGEIKENDSLILIGVIPSQDLTPDDTVIWKVYHLGFTGDTANLRIFWNFFSMYPGREKMSGGGGNLGRLTLYYKRRSDGTNHIEWEWDFKYSVISPVSVIFNRVIRPNVSSLLEGRNIKGERLLGREPKLYISD